jgi:autoinducer 2-degrading protein
MLVIHVQIQVRPDCIEAFRTATLANASASRQEAGVLRYDVVQHQEDPARWLLWEVYRSPAAHAAHRETAHYVTWRDTVESMMAVPRVGTKYHTVSPADDAW